MFTQRFRSYPATGKTGELRALLEEVVRARLAEGKTSRLSQVVFGDDSGALTSLHVHDDLAAFQAFRERNQSDPAGPARAQRAAGLTARPGQMHLAEVVIPFPPGGAPARFGTTTTFVATPGQGLALRAALAEFVAARQKAGSRVSLSASASGTTRLLVSTVVGSMAEYEATRAAVAASPEFAVLSPSMGLLAEPPNAEIFEILL